MKFLIDGIDRLGKSTLVKNLQEELGYHLVVHYDKPKDLRNHRLYNVDGKLAELSKEASLKIYQEQTNKYMFELMKSPVPIIFDRTHLGEMVYAPLYRNYQGDYVFDEELSFIFQRPKNKDVLLILLTTSNFEILKDDGQSFNWDKKALEQELFKSAFNKSSLPKLRIDVHNGHGQYKDPYDILQEVLAKIS